MTKPNDYAPDRAAKLKQWERNRDHTNGVDAVKAAKTKYLPRDRTMSNEDYAAHLIATTYLPAAARTLESHAGLIFRKPPTLTAPAALVSLADVMTADGETAEWLSRWAFREYAISNSGGILIDHPEMPEGTTTLAQAMAMDLRPFASCYPAETILEVAYGVVGGRKRLKLVRLLESETKVRFLEMIDGQYTITIYEEADGEWHITSRSVPLSQGKPLTDIPFVHLADAIDRGAIFDDICAENHTHYVKSGEHATALRWLSKPKPWVSGLADDIDLDVSPGAIWRFESPDTKCGFLEMSGTGLKEITDDLNNLKELMAQLGSRLLTSEKAAAEAAETVARRQASENSILASMARHVGSRIEDALRLMAMWVGIDPAAVSFQLSTDFVPTMLDPQMIAQLMALNNAGKLTDRELFEALQKGEIISETVDYEAHQAELDSTNVDPPLGA